MFLKCNSVLQFIIIYVSIVDDSHGSLTRSGVQPGTLEEKQAPTLASKLSEEEAETRRRSSGSVASEEGEIMTEQQYF